MPAESEGIGHPALTQRAPGKVAAGFGLLHDLGFAGALAEVGLPTAGPPQPRAAALGSYVR